MFTFLKIARVNAALVQITTLRKLLNSSLKVNAIKKCPDITLIPEKMRHLGVYQPSAFRLHIRKINSYKCAVEM